MHHRSQGLGLRQTQLQIQEMSTPTKPHHMATWCYLRDGEVDDGWVLLHKKIVLGEPLDAEDEVRRQLGELEALQEILLVGFIFLKKAIFEDILTHENLS